MKSLFIAILVLLASPAFALKSAYLTADHPDGWNCEFSGGVWVCQSQSEADRKESVVLSIATLATDWDTVENYEDYLKTPRQIEDENGNKFNSEVRYVRKRNINGHVWIDSLQYNSELPGFWARYVVTVNPTPKAKLAILLTYIVSDEHYKQLAPQFERMISSIKLNMEFDLNEATKQGQPPLTSADKLGPIQKDILATRLRNGKPTATPAPGGDMTMTYLMLVGLVAGVAYFLIQRRKKKQKTAKGNSPAPRPGSPPTRKTG